MESSSSVTAPPVLRDCLVHVVRTPEFDYDCAVRLVPAVIAGALLSVAALQADEEPRNIEEFMMLRSPTRVIAHRGFSGRAPENTLAAIRQAVAVGADMVEIDVTMTSDGHVIILHDETLNRTTDGTGPATGKTLAEIRELDAGSWFGPAYQGERVPSLIEVLDAVRGRILINVEIKPEAVERGIATGVAALIAGHDMSDQVVVSSFSPAALQQIKAIDPAIVTMSLFNDELHAGRDPLEIVQEAGSRGLNISNDWVTPALVERCHRHGIPVGVYTVNSRRRMRRLIDMGVHSIFTDRPDRLLEVLAEGDASGAAEGIVKAAS
jgi:glycerophosphoryl diester phosphodiesterase